MRNRIFMCAALLLAAPVWAEGEQVNVIPSQTEVQGASFVYEPIQVRPATSPAGMLNANMMFIADQLDRNSDRLASERPIVITRFAPLDDVTTSSPLGRLMAEQLTHEFKVRGWNVLDVRLMREIADKDGSDFSVPRDMPKLRETLPLGAVMVGTYASTADGVLVSARVIDVATGAVLSTAQTRVPKDKFIAQLVDKPLPLPVLKVMP